MNINTNNDKKWAEEMIEELAEVKSVGQGYAEVLPEVSGSCSSCTSNSSCSSSSGNSGNGDTFSFFTGAKVARRTVRVQNPVYAKPGDTVVVGVRSNTVLKSSILAYLLPLITLIVFAALGDILASSFAISSEIGSILMGLFGLYIGFQIIAGLFNNPVISNDFEAVILRVVEAEVHPVTFSLST